MVNQIKKKYSIILSIILFLFSISLVSGESTYSNYGGLNQDFYSDDSSIFNSGITTEYISSSKLLTDGGQLPFIIDLDNNGDSELFVLDDNTINLYSINQTSYGTELFLLYSYSTSETLGTNYFSNIVTYDIDQDNNSEIIFHTQGTDNHIYMLGWNGTHLFDKSSLDVSISYNAGTPEDSADSGIGCGDRDGCLIVFNNGNDYDTPNIRTLQAQYFNSTGTGALYTLRTGTAQYCLPYQLSIPYGNGAYYLVYLPWNQRATIDKISINESFEVVGIRASLTTGQLGATSCGFRGITTINSPLLNNFKGSVSDGLEVSFAYQTTATKFRMIAMDKDLTEISSYPKLEESEGQILSNQFKSTAIKGIEGQESCVLGYDKTNYEFIILCASYNNGGLLTFALTNLEFTYDFTEPPNFNLTNYHSSWSVTAHSINSVDNGLSQILTSFGIFSLEDYTEAGTLSNCKRFGNCEAELLYQLPFSVEGGAISIDPFNSELEDIIYMTDNNLFYLEDGFTNQNAYLGYCTKIDPDPNNVIKLHIDNSTNNTNEIRITAIVIDPEGNTQSDAVGVRAILYFGESNAQDTGWVNLSSGASYMFTGLLPNETTSSSILRIYYKDNYNYFESPLYTDTTFRVQTTGDLRGESNTCLGLTDSEYDESISDDERSEGDYCITDSNCATGYFCGTDDECHSDATNPNNAANTALKEFSGWTGLSVGFIFLIIMAIIIYSLFMERDANSNPVIIIAGVIATLFFGIIFGVKLGLIGVGTIIILSLLGIIVGGIIVGKLFFSSRSSGGN